MDRKYEKRTTGFLTPDNWLTTYSTAVNRTAMAPVGVDPIMQRLLIQATTFLPQQTRWRDVLHSSLNPSQRLKLASDISHFHISIFVPLLGEGFDTRTLSSRQIEILKMASHHYFVEHQSPSEVPGIYFSSFSEQDIQLGIIYQTHIENKIWKGGIIGGTFKALLNLINNVEGLNGRALLKYKQVDSHDSLLTEDNARRLDEFSTSAEYAEIIGMTLNRYDAAISALDSDEGREIALRQRNAFNAHLGGNPRTRATDELEKLNTLVKNAVLGIQDDLPNVAVIQLLKNMINLNNFSK